MKFLNKLFLLISSILLRIYNTRISTTQLGNFSEEMMEKAKKSIVLIKSRIDVPFILDSDETKQSTGFIINKEKGLILTSKKTARMSPCNIKVQFYDGSISNGKVIYSDPFLPFGLIEVENKDNISTTLNKRNFFPSANVLLICLADDENYVIKQGKIVNTNRNYHSKYGSLFQTNIDRVKGLNGCPVFSENGDVIGIHYLATLTTSYELRIDYVNNILPNILTSTPVKRGDIGVSINLLIFGVAKINFKLNEKISDEIAKSLETTGGPPEIMVCSSVSPRSTALGKLKSGDILYKINDQIIGNNFLLVDKILNTNIGKTVKIVVSRNSNIIEQDILVHDAEKEKVKKYVSFSGAYFHDINNFVSNYLSTGLKGVYLTYAKNGSPFNKISMSSNNKNNYILTSINSNKISNLDEFIQYLKNNCDNESIYVEGLDFNASSGSLSADAVDLDFSSSLLNVFEYNQYTKKYISNSINLKDLCSKRVKTIKYSPHVKNHNTHLEIIDAKLKIEEKHLNTTTPNLNNSNLDSNHTNKIISTSNNRLNINNNSLSNHVFDYKKNFFFKEENQTFDKIPTNDRLLNSNLKGKFDESVVFLHKNLKTKNDRKVNNKFLYHLTSLHRFHI